MPDSDCGESLQQISKLRIDCGVSRGNKGPGGQAFRCEACNSLRSRLNRMFKKLGDGEKGEFSTMTKDQRREFFKTHHNAMGDDLSAATQAVVSHETIRETDFELVGSCTFIDEDDWTDNSKIKPQQLVAI